MAIDFSGNIIYDGVQCTVVSGTHKGKTGKVEDIKISKTGAITITVRQSDDQRLKTLAKNVIVKE